MGALPQAKRHFRWIRSFIKNANQADCLGSGNMRKPSMPARRELLEVLCHSPLPDRVRGGPAAPASSHGLACRQHRTLPNLMEGLSAHLAFIAIQLERASGELLASTDLTRACIPCSSSVSGGAPRRVPSPVPHSGPRKVAAQTATPARRSFRRPSACRQGCAAGRRPSGPPRLWPGRRGSSGR